MPRFWKKHSWAIDKKKELDKFSDKYLAIEIK